MAPSREQRDDRGYASDDSDGEPYRNLFGSCAPELDALEKAKFEGYVRDPKHANCAERSDPHCQELHYIPTGRPLAEPPMLDYDDFITNKLPSDKRFSRLFPGDIEKWIRCRDLETEQLLLGEYRECVRTTMYYEKDPERQDFYRHLTEDLWMDLIADSPERDASFEGVSDISHWEYNYLDQNGGTSQIESWTAKDWIASISCSEAWEKYGHLASCRVPSPEHWWRQKKGIACLSWCSACDSSIDQEEQKLHFQDWEWPSYYNGTLQDVLNGTTGWISPYNDVGVEKRKRVLRTVLLNGKVTYVPIHPENPWSEKKLVDDDPAKQLHSNSDVIIAVDVLNSTSVFSADTAEELEQHKHSSEAAVVEAQVAHHELRLQFMSVLLWLAWALRFALL